CGDKRGGKLVYRLVPTLRLVRHRSSGPARSSQSGGLVSRAARRVKGAKGHLPQRRNCYVSNAGTGCDSLRGRSADDQCRSRGSETVVVDGVTPVQGARENRAQGEGSQGSEVHYHRSTERTDGARPYQE